MFADAKRVYVGQSAVKNKFKQMFISQVLNVCRVGLLFYKWRLVNRYVVVMGCD